jgi:3-oxoacyl-[acyl-carrier protein] reductase
MLKNRIAIITGASRGIGAHVSKVLVENGANVIGVSRSTIHASHVHHKYSVNVGDYQSVNDMFNDLKSKEIYPDILVNCAGTSKDAFFSRLNENAIREVINVNLEGSIYMSRAFAKMAMTRKHEERDFCITNMGSPIGSLIFPAGTSIYSATKAALYGLTKSLSVELLPYHIRVNMIRPGYVKTELTRNLDFSKLPYNETNIDDVAHAVMYLCTNKSVNGTVMDVNGGLH